MEEISLFQTVEEIATQLESLRNDINGFLAFLKSEQSKKQCLLLLQGLSDPTMFLDTEETLNNSLPVMFNRVKFILWNEVKVLNEQESSTLDERKNLLILNDFFMKFLKFGQRIGFDGSE